jgi:hypothetical protein
MTPKTTSLLDLASVRKSMILDGRILTARRVRRSLASLHFRRILSLLENGLS